MDGDSVEDEPSEPLSLAEVFYETFPYYLAMGMSYDEYWRDNPSLVRAYRKAWEIKQRNDEYDRWRRGMYAYDALIRVSPILRAFGDKNAKPIDYPDMPYPLTEKEAEEREKQRELENTKAFIARLEAESERELKRREEAKKQEVNDDGEH